jgi:hypothetical protein
MKNLDTRSLDAYAQSSGWYRNYFAEEVVGRFDQPLLPRMSDPARPTMKRKWVGYEVMLDVFPDVIAYGILLLPRDLKPDEKRPVVVCQHGLEGRPQDVVAGDQRYHNFASGWRNAASSRLRRRTLHFHRPLPHAATQEQSDQENAVLDDRSAAPADRQLAEDPAECGPPSESASMA